MWLLSRRTIWRRRRRAQGFWRAARRRAMIAAMTRRAVPRKTTARYLENSALHHLGRFSSSAGNLRRILMRKVEKSARAHGTDRDDGAALVAALIERFERSGLLDDGDYAKARAVSLLRRGRSARAIRADLAAKGVARAEIDAALEGLSEESAAPELAAAITHARRRRLGPYRPPADRAERRERDLASLARAGFDYATARRIIEAEGPDALEALSGADETPP